MKKKETIKKRSLAFLLALIMILTGLGPGFLTGPSLVSAKEEESQTEHVYKGKENTSFKLKKNTTGESQGLQSLEVYAKDENGKEVNFVKNFGMYQKEYDINLPRETREIIIKAEPRSTKGYVSFSNSDHTKFILNEENDFTTSFPIKPGYGEGDFSNGINYSVHLGVQFAEDVTISEEITYKLNLKVAGYPKPVIRGIQDRYIFEQNERVTKADILKGVTATDEVFGDLTDQIELSGGNWNQDGTLDTRFLTHETLNPPKSLYIHVINPKGVRTDIYPCPTYSIVKQKPKDFDGVKPEIRGLPQGRQKAYIGLPLTKEDLLKGITAWDNVDDDVTEKIQLVIDDKVIGPEDVYTPKSPPVYFIAYYIVEDAAGNKTKENVIYDLEEAPKTSSLKEPDIPKIIDNITRSYYGKGDDWSAIALAMNGKKRLIHKETLLTKAQAKLETRPEKATEYERIAVALTAAGLDPRKVPLRDGTMDLIRTIQNHEPMGTLNDYIWALIAYDSGNYSIDENAKWTRDALIKYLLDHQLSDGSWDLNNKHSGLVDVDITAMTIIALAPYKDQAKVKKALDRGVDILSKAKTKDCTYLYGAKEGAKQDPKKWVPTSESTSQVILALSSLGINPHKDPRFLNGNRSILDGQLSFITENYRFRHVNELTDQYFPVEDPIATVQGVQALTAYEKAKAQNFTPFYPYQFADYSGHKPDKPDTPDRPDTPDKPDTPVDPGTLVTLYELKINKLPNKRVYMEGEKPSLEGLEVEGVYSDGSRKNIPIEEIDIKGFTTDTWSPNREVIISYGGRTNSFNIEVKAGEKDQKTARIYVADPKGKTYYSEKDLPIKEGTETAFSLLEKTGLKFNYNYHPVYAGAYVSSIEGLAEFDGGPNSGWMYRVNGVFPNHSASLHKIYAGDKVEWLYTRDLGKDLGAKFEEEEEGYQVIINHNAGGQVSPSGQVKVKKGESLNLTIKPDQGYAIDRVLVDGQNQGKVTSYQLSNIDSNHRVEVQFVQVKDLEAEDLEDQKQETKTLKDIQGHWGQEAMEYCLKKGYFKGRGDGTFGADAPVSRGDFVTVLGRRRKAPLKTEKVFKDVNPKTYYGPYLVWAKEEGIAQGYQGKFRPKDSMTRQEMAKVLSSYLQKEGKLKKQGKADFKDQKTIASWALPSVGLLKANGIVEGDQERNFKPQRTLSRAEAAQVLYQMDRQ